MLKKTIIFIISTILIINLSGCTNSEKGNQFTNSNKIKQSSQKSPEEANKEIKKIIKNFHEEKDDVEKITFYLPFNGTYTTDNHLYWYLVQKDNILTQRFLLIQFSSNIDWVFWDTLNFSTNEGNWIYKAQTFAGQTGGGKQIQIINGGKFEKIDLPLEDVLPGIKLLLSGTNPIIRLDGKEFYYDYKLTENDLAHLRDAITVYTNLKITNNKLLN